MSMFVQSTVAPAPKASSAGRVAILAAGMITILLVAQLFSYEKFAAILYDMWLPGVMRPESAILAALVVTMELLALPFLLRMRLSPAMRALSMVAGWLVVLFWLLVTVWENVTLTALGNAGLLGATIALPVGWWLVLFAIALAIVDAWASWGLWPFGRKR